MVGVVTILLVLTFRFTNLDFKIDQSAFTLVGVFMIYAICPYLASNSNHFVGFVINFVSILSIIIFTCNNMMYANHTVLILSYFLLYGNPVTSIRLVKSLPLASCAVIPKSLNVNPSVYCFTSTTSLETIVGATANT